MSRLSYIQNTGDLPHGVEHEVAPGNVQAEYGNVVYPLHQLAPTAGKLCFRLQQQHQGWEKDDFLKYI